MGSIGPMKLTTSVLFAAVLVLFASTARADERTGYVNIPRAINECRDGKKAIAEFQADVEARQKALAEVDAARKAKKTPPYLQPDEQWRKQQTDKGQAASDRITARLLRILPAIAKARRLSIIAPAQTMVYVVPSLDLTDELVRRYDAGEGDDRAAELAAAKAKVAALESETKVASPPKPAPPKTK